MDKSVRFKDITGFYRDKGNGPVTICLLHGFPMDSSVWKEFSEPLTDKYRVITPDLPGFGKTPLPENSLSMEWMAAFVHAIIEKEEIEKVILIGHSMGGYVALAYAEKYSNSVQGMGLFHSTARADNEEKKANRKKAVNFVERNGKELFVKELFNNLFNTGFLPGNEKIKENLVERAMKLRNKSFIGAYKAMMHRPDRTHILNAAPFPVLFIYGKLDSTLPYQSGLEQCHLPDESMICLLERSAHMGMMEEAGESGLAILNFINYIEINHKIA